MAATSSAMPAHTEISNAEPTPDDSSKLKMFLGILRKFIGVSDMASVRFSLPSQLIEPRPNLEYWNYMDAPFAFAAIGDSQDPLDRMLEVLRFWFTKDLKYIHGKPCKPYNSALGEFFRCNWEVTEAAPSISSLHPPVPTSKASSIRSSTGTPGVSRKNSIVTAGNTPLSKLATPVRISYLTEQTSHHPPVSAFHISCPQKGLTARGFDQISAKFTGTSIKVTPGEHNSGIFITSETHGEQYQLTHPAAHLGGLMRGSLNVTVSDQCYVTCPQTGMKAILHYIEEGWLGKAQNKVDGVIFRYDPRNDHITRIKDVSERDVLARISGNWKDKLYCSLGASKEQFLLLDVQPLSVAPKITPPLSIQLPNESLRFWNGVTEAINTKQYNKATQVKQDLEDAQRAKTKRREDEKREWEPRFFTGTVTPKGIPELSENGRELLGYLQNDSWDLPKSVVAAVESEGSV